MQASEINVDAQIKQNYEFWQNLSQERIIITQREARNQGKPDLQFSVDLSLSF